MVTLFGDDRGSRAKLRCCQENLALSRPDGLLGST